jgi:PAS domain S-box-containing protein
MTAHGFDVAQTVDELSAQLDEARQLLSAIRTGEVDALVVPGPRGDQVYSLTGAEHPYRVLVEAMSEGAVILADDGTIVYSNPGFAALVRAPVDEVIGSALDRFVAADDLRSYRTVVDAAGSGAAKGEIRLAGKDGATVPVHLSISAFESMAPRSVCAVVTNLSEQKRHEELISAEKVERARRAEAEAARQRVQSVLESITDSYFAIDREWRITDANERAAANYGMTRDELVGKTFWDLSRSNIVPERDEQYRRAMNERVAVHGEGPSAVVRGKWFETHIYPDGDGLSIYFRDITERKRAEQALQRSEANLAEAQRLSHTGSWRWNVSTEGCTGSLELFRIFGLDPGTFRPTIENTQVLIHPQDLPVVVETLERSIRERSGFALDYRITRADGSMRFHHAVGHPTINDSGELEFVGSVVDLTDRRQAEERVRRSEALLAEGQRISRTGSWIFNVASGELLWSAEHYRISGVDPATFPLSPEAASQCIHPDDRAASRQMFDRALRERSDFERELRMVRPDGTVRHCLSVGHPVLDEKGDLIEYVGMIADITDQKEQEAVRDELRRQLLASQEDERRRIALEMHDQFGQQLSALALKLSALKRDSAGRTTLAQQLDSLETIARQLDRDLESIVRRLRPTALDDLGLAAALTQYVNQWSEHFEIHADVHATGVDAVRMTDETSTALYRITMEALNNVARHARAKNVSVLLDGRTDRVSVIVEDDGVGFATAEVKADQRCLGIVGMRERAALLGGSLDVESRLGAGTTVVARIPTPQELPRGRR